jgi:hypothetical protein
MGGPPRAVHAPVSKPSAPLQAPTHQESIPMTRPASHAATRPFRVNRSAAEAHRDHLPTPFLGCAICARRAAMRPIQIRWTSPRLG